MPISFADASPDDLFQALAEVSLTGVVLLRLVYPAAPAPIVDPTDLRLNLAAQRMLARPECPADSLPAPYPAPRVTGFFAFCRNPFPAHAPGRPHLN